MSTRHAATTTALCLDNGATLIRPNEGARLPFPRFMSEPGAPLPSDRLRYQALEDAITSQYDSVEQADEDPGMTIALDKALGRGAHGEAYTCEVHLTGDGSTQRLVIKLPRFPVLNVEAARRNLEKEFTHAESLLEPALVRSLERGRPGAPLPRMSAEVYFRVAAARCAHAAHLGYAFLHRPIHYAPAFSLPRYHPDGPIPIMLSERADGDLEMLTNARQAGTRLRLGADGTPPPLWIVIAWQVLQGIDFINSVCDLAHLDIKPANILFQGDPDRPESLRCLIGDFGMVAARDSMRRADKYMANYRLFRCGTRTHTPRVLPTQPPEISCALLSDFECLSTLASMLQFAERPAWFWYQKGDHVATAISNQISDAYRYFDTVKAPCTRVLLDFCEEAEGMESWDELADLCWGQLRPEVEALLRETFPDMLRAYTDRADAYARDAETATRMAEVYAPQEAPVRGC